MTAEGFRTLALALPEAVESAHMDHPDFRAAGKIFASLGYPGSEHGMVKLTPEQQAAFIEKDPAAFAPCKGAWGLRGATSVHLGTVSKRTLQAALEAAIGNLTAPKTKRPRKQT